MSNALLSTLVEMLTYCRPHGSDADREFRARYLLSLPGAILDDYGNIRVRVNDDPVLWSAHTDTVHRASGRQSVHVDARGIIKLTRRSRKSSACLGADDTAGCFVLREMINRGIGGTYVFHYGEERGGIGSGQLAWEDPSFLESFLYAIAIDRAHTDDIITHQSFGRTASDAFAYSLADQLNACGLDYAPSSGGIYTDTAEYAEIIPECTNLSCGYEHAHSDRETLDSSHVLRLLDALCTVRIGDLVCARDPHAIDLEDRWPFDRSPIVDVSARSIDWSDFDWSDEDEVRALAVPADRPMYLDPEWQQVQEALERYERERERETLNRLERDYRERIGRANVQRAYPRRTK